MLKLPFFLRNTELKFPPNLYLTFHSWSPFDPSCLFTPQPARSFLFFHGIIRHFQFRKCLPVNSNYKVSYFLSLESCLWKREPNDNRSLGELFLYFSDKMSDITWIQAFQMLLQMFRTMLSDNTELSDEKINELANAFMNALPTMMKIRLQAA